MLLKIPILDTKYHLKILEQILCFRQEAFFFFTILPFYSKVTAYI